MSAAAEPAGELDPGSPVVLAEPVRQRLVQIASEVLGRLTSDEIPATLRPYAKFTPAKRQRLGATAISAALDADADFRGRVAETVAEVSPQLVAALREGEQTPASDPVDTAVVAYLTRPDGWQHIVADITARWRDVRTGKEAAAEEAARLRDELLELRGRLKAETARVHDAAAAASADATEEATRLRNTLRARTSELRAAEQAVEQARTETVQARLEVETLRAGHEAEVRKLRGRIADLERSLEAARRETRQDRDVDDARLRLLLDALTDAAAGVRRELNLPAGTLRPADAVGAAASGPGVGRTVTDVAALDRLLEVPQLHVIVDGYNVTKTGYADLPLNEQRTRLVSSMAALRARSASEVTVVFDGGARPPAAPHAPRGVRVLFSAPDEIADDLIRRLVKAEPVGRALLVATSDQAVVADVRAAGAWTVPSAVLLQRLS